MSYFVSLFSDEDEPLPLSFHSTFTGDDTSPGLQNGYYFILIIYPQIPFGSGHYCNSDMGYSGQHWHTITFP